MGYAQNALPGFALRIAVLDIQSEFFVLQRIEE